MAFATMFYWAAYIGDYGKDLVDLFLIDLGYSPFVGFYRGLSPVVGAIRGGQLQMFKYLVENSRWNLPIVHLKEGDEPGTTIEKQRALALNKYFFKDITDVNSFEQGRRSTDNLGNNILHHIFYIDRKSIRNDFL
jgi:hypothetical protein